MSESTPEYTGLSVDYYDLTITKFTHDRHRHQKSISFCLNDVIEALDLNYAQANVIKAQWRIAADKQGKCKKGNNTFYDAEKSCFFSSCVLRQMQVTDDVPYQTVTAKELEDHLDSQILSEAK